MSFEDELHELHEAPVSKARIVACADLAQRAMAVDDRAMAVSAKQYETQTACQLGMHQHAVVCCAEQLEIWDKIKDRGDELPAEVQSRLVWTLKQGAGSAMDLPEIPLSTVRELIGALHDVLSHFGSKRFAAWELEARLAYIEGDKATIEDRVAKLAPTISVRSHLWDHADCPGCTIMQFVTFLGMDAPIEEIEAALAPLFDPAPFPLDEDIGHIVKLLYGEDKMCENAERWYPSRMARAYTRAGQLAKAEHLAQKALAANASCEAERRLRAQVAAMEVALAADQLDEARGRYERALATFAEEHEDPYALLDAHKACHRAARRLGLPVERHRTEAIALAKRVDARLPTPRHERETLAALDA